MPSQFSRRLRNALESGLEYILQKQRPDGSWVDWKLPPGESSIWTTAFVGCRISRLPIHLRNQAASARAIAANWLESKMFSDHGWGYNEEVESDADSTALAIQFLASENKSIANACYRRLENFQRCDGGFSTYSDAVNLGSWAMSHADVTPAAVLAMMTRSGTTCDSRIRAIQFVRRSQTQFGLWESFWWTSPLYSTSESLSLLKSTHIEIDGTQTTVSLSQIRAQHAFESALLISSVLSLPGWPSTQRVYDLVADLLEQQQSDGSWKSGPMLRVTRRDCVEPWKSGDPDELFGDQNRLFTTATVLNSISRFGEHFSRSVQVGLESA